MSLVSLSVGLAIGMLVMSVGVALTMYTGTSFAILCNLVSLNNSSQNALSQLSKEIRQVKSVTSFDTNTITFTDFDGQPLQYAYDPSSKKLNRIKAGTTQVLLDDINTFTFSILQRNVTDGTYDRVVATNTLTAKAVRVTVARARVVGGHSSTLEDVQSADIVIRNGL